MLSVITIYTFSHVSMVSMLWKPIVPDAQAMTYEEAYPIVIYNLNTSNRRGQVIVHVQKDLTNVQIRENSDTMKTLMEEE